MLVAGLMRGAGTPDDGKHLEVIATEVAIEHPSPGELPLLIKQGRADSLPLSNVQTEAKSDRLRVVGTTIQKSAPRAAALMPEEPVPSLLAPFFADEAAFADPFVPISLSAPDEYGARGQPRPGNQRPD